jgi:ribosomal protein S12 methylthiotransferase accessory factor
LLESSSDTILLAQQLVSRRIGLIRHVQERRETPDGFDIIDVVAKLRGHMADGHWVSEVNGGGHFSRTQAQAAAIGECIERYALGLYEPSQLVHATLHGVAEVARPIADAQALRFFADAQYAMPGFPVRRFEPDAPLRWALGSSALSGEPLAVPASLVYLPYSHVASEYSLSCQMSIGSSCHTSPAEAALRAILEIVERDALTICWESRTSFPPIAARQVNEVSRTLGMPGLQLACFDLGNDLGIPVVLTLAMSPHREPEVAIGIAAHMDGMGALEKSVAEALTSFRSSIALCKDDLRPQAEILAELRKSPRLDLHALYHARRGALAGFDFLLASPLPPVTMGPASQRDAAMLLRDLLGRLGRAGLETALFDLTPDEVRGYGLCVVRAVITGLVRQTVGLALRHLGNPRVLEVPARLGYPSACTTLAEILDHQVPYP